MRQFLSCLALCALVLFSTTAGANGQTRDRGDFDRFIVMFKPGARANAGLRQRVLDAGAKRSGVAARQALRLSFGSEVVVLNRKLPAAAAHAFMNRLRLDPNVEYVELDRVVKAATSPNDLYYLQGYQWNMYDRAGGINAPPAWSMSTGYNMIIAVLDTGRTDHLDVPFWTGYDFITDSFTANDGGGRDATAIDAGDWNAAGACGVGSPATDSSWHGTLVAGIAGAIGNNNTGIAGTSYSGTVLPVRVLGRCGGYISDLADAIRWTIGGSVPGVPVNAFPADVINLSLSSPGLCEATLQTAINEAVAAGVPVVVAAGNDAADASGTQPANCQNVITVGATTRRGDLAFYSNTGEAVDVLAPGGDSGGYIASTFNSGLTVPAAPNYALTAGTSMAAPQVSGVVALMQAAQPSSPAAVEAMLKSTARPPMLPCPASCGAGIINAAAAVGAAKGGMLSIDDTQMREGDAGTQAMVFTVRLSKPMAVPVTFDITTNNVFLDTDNGDFNLVTLLGQVIPPGQTTYTYYVPIRGDTNPEVNETLRVVVSNITGIGVADDTALGLIINDDPMTVLEGNWSGTLGHSLEAEFNTLNAGEYALVKFEVPAGATALNVYSGIVGGANITPFNDGDLYVRYGDEPTLTVADCIQQTIGIVETCHFDNPRAGTWYAMLYAYSRETGGAIRFQLEPATTPVLSINDAGYTEGNSGSWDMNFKLELSFLPTSDVFVDIATEPGTASPGSDYQSVNIPGFKIPAGTYSADFTVKVNGDTDVEGHENFVVNLSNPVGTKLKRTQATGKIFNDDLANLRVSGGSVTEGNNGEHVVSFLVELSKPMPNPVTFGITTLDGTALAGSDYVARSQPNRYLDTGRTRQTFEVTFLGDAVPEPDETMYVALYNVAGAAGPTTGGSLVTIVNDDGAPVASPVRSASGPAPVRASAALKSESCRLAGSKSSTARRKLPLCPAKPGR